MYQIYWMPKKNESCGFLDESSLLVLVKELELQEGSGLTMDREIRPVLEEEQFENAGFRVVLEFHALVTVLGSAASFFSALVFFVVFLPCLQNVLVA